MLHAMEYTERVYWTCIILFTLLKNLQFDVTLCDSQIFTVKIPALGFGSHHAVSIQHNNDDDLLVYILELY